MKKIIYLVHCKNDWHNGDMEEKTYAFTSKEKAEEKAAACNKKVEKWNKDNGIEIAYRQHGKSHDFYENDCEDRFYVRKEKTWLIED